MNKYFGKTISTDTNMLCPVCGGTGRELWKHYVDGKYVEEKVKCAACAGSGTLRIDDENEDYMWEQLYLNRSKLHG